MEANKWHFQKDGEAKGPFSDEQLKAFCEVGTVHAGTHVWRPGFPEWKPLASTDFQYKSVISPPPPRFGSNAPGGQYHQPPSGGGSFPSDDYVVEDLSLLEYFFRGVSDYYVKFSGRARRKEYWGFVLFEAIFFFSVILLGVAVDASVGNIGQGSRDEPIIMIVLGAIFYLGTFLPRLAVLARRLHDINMSAWFMLVGLIPYIGALVLFIMTLLGTHPGRNQYGPSPIRPYI